MRSAFLFEIHLANKFLLIFNIALNIFLLLLLPYFSHFNSRFNFVFINILHLIYKYIALTLHVLDNIRLKKLEKGIFMKKKYLSESIMKYVFLISALTSIFAIILICIFIFGESIPFVKKIGLFEFIGGKVWSPVDVPAKFGILPMIIGSIYVTLGAIIIGVPIGILTAIYLSKFCPKKLYSFLRPCIDLMVGIPSIVYGFFALVVIVPIVRKAFGGTGMNILTASILLGIMILPTIITLSESAINTVVDSYYEGSIALGASHELAVMGVVVPAAKSGILSSVILGIGRAIGETMAVYLVAGNQPVIAKSIFSGTRTMTTNIVLDMAYASGDHREALIATAMVLFVFILIINLVFNLIKRGVNDGK